MTISYLRAKVLIELDLVFEYWGSPFVDTELNRDLYARDRAAIDAAMSVAAISEQMLIEFYGTVSFLHMLLSDISNLRESHPNFTPDEEYILSRLGEASDRLLGVQLSLYSAFLMLKNAQAQART